MILVSLPAAVNGAMRPTTVFIKWCDLKRRFDILILKAKESYPFDFYVPQLVRFISHLGFEVEELIIIKERSSELDARIVGGVAHKILISAIEHLGHLREVYPKSSMNEINFKNHKDIRNSLGLGPVAIIFIAAIIVQLAAQLGQLAAQLWGLFAQNFGTKVTTKLVAHFRNSGFRSYAMKATIKRNCDVRERNIDRFSRLLTEVVTLGHPDGRKKLKIGAAISSCTPMDDQHLTLSNGDIDTGAASDDRFFSIISHKHEAGDAYSFMSMQMEAPYELAPDLLIYNKSTGYVGGIYAKTESVIEEIPREVTADDAKVLQAFNLGLALKLFSDDLDVEGKRIVDYPGMPQ